MCIRDSSYICAYFINQNIFIAIDCFLFQKNARACRLLYPGQGAKADAFLPNCKITPAHCAEAGPFLLNCKITPVHCAEAGPSLLNCKISLIHCAETSSFFLNCKIPSPATLQKRESQGHRPYDSPIPRIAFPAEVFSFHKNIKNNFL